MTNANDPAYPTGNERQTGPDSYHFSGLTMQGLCANTYTQNQLYERGENVTTETAELSVKIAQATIAALNASEGK
jgi:hypothetical protein